MIYLALLFSLWFVSPVLAHTGTLDAYGCHSDFALFKNTTTRECHQGLLAGKTFTSTTAEYVAYIAAQNTVIVDLKVKLDICQARCPVVSIPADVKVSWQANAEPDLAGYILYCGTASHVYTMNQKLAKVLTGTFPQLPGGKTYYCAVTAYDQSGNESPFSQEVTKVLP